MKKIILLNAVLFLVLSAFAQNLIVNGDMSDYRKSNFIPKGYATTKKSTFSLFENGFGLDGVTLNAMNMTYNHEKQTNSRYITTPLTLEGLEKGKYKLTFYLKGKGWIRTVNLASEGQDVPGSTKNNAPSLITNQFMGKSRSVTEYAEWTKIELTYNVNYSDNTTLKYCVCFAFNNGMTGDTENTLSIANISLVKYD